MSHQTARQVGILARWWARTRDAPETFLLYGAVAGCIGMGLYAAKKVYLSSDAGAFVDVNMRGDPMKQTEEAATGGKHTPNKTIFFRKVAAIQTHGDGNYDIGVWPFSNPMNNKHPIGIGNSGGANIPEDRM